MITTIYKCDRCKKEVDKNKLLRIGFGIERYASGNTCYFNSESKHDADWCEDCCHEIGIKFKPTPEPQPTTLPTLEDIIREWIYEAVSER